MTGTAVAEGAAPETPAAAEPTAPKAPVLLHELNSLSELDVICRTPRQIRFSYRNKWWSVKASSLTPKEASRIKLLMTLALPPVIKGDVAAPGKEPVNGTERWDFRDPAYIEKKARNQRLARALAVYWACPIYRQEKPGLIAEEEILEFVESKLTDEILDAIGVSIMEDLFVDEKEIAERINFTSPTASPSN